jgi:hypothetical protein
MTGLFCTIEPAPKKEILVQAADPVGHPSFPLRQGLNSSINARFLERTFLPS